MKKPRGRPRLDPATPSVRVHLTLSARQYDQLYAVARDGERSVPDVIRRTLRLNDPNNRDAV